MPDQSLSPIVDSSHIDVAIAAWLDVKKRRSGSEKTRRAYSDTLFLFRTQLQQTGRDLDPDGNLYLQGEEGEKARQRALAEIALAAQGFAGRPGKNNAPISASTYNLRLAIL